MEVLNIILTVLIVIDSIVLCVIILMQQGKDAGLGAISGSSGWGDSYVSRNQRHTPEGKLKTATIVCAILFMVLAIVINVVANYI